MFNVQSLDDKAVTSTVDVGQPVLSRGKRPETMFFIESGRVALGVLQDHILVHQIGVLEGPCWLDASSAVLNVSSLVDGVATSRLVVRSVPLVKFQQLMATMSKPARSVLIDLALTQRRQTEFAVSRMAKDAESRCAEWLLSHAVRQEEGVLAVELQQRKRSIATQLGITPETFSRVLRHLRDQSLISGSGRVLHVINPQALRALAGV